MDVIVLVNTLKIIKIIFNMIIAIDFDGTCVTHEFPKIGKDIGAIPVLKELTNKGHKLILFTMRSNRTDNNSINVNPFLFILLSYYLLYYSNIIEFYKYFLSYFLLFSSNNLKSQHNLIKKSFLSIVTNLYNFSAVCLISSVFN